MIKSYRMVASQLLQDKEKYHNFHLWGHSYILPPLPVKILFTNSEHRHIWLMGYEREKKDENYIYIVYIVKR